MSNKLANFYSGYGSYHDNIVNKSIHIFCIPILTTTLQGLMIYFNK